LYSYSFDPFLHGLRYFTLYKWVSAVRLTNRQKLLTFYCLWLFILTIRPSLIMSKTSDDSLFASGVSVIIWLRSKMYPGMNSEMVFRYKTLSQIFICQHIKVHVDINKFVNVRLVRFDSMTIRLTGRYHTTRPPDFDRTSGFDYCCCVVWTHRKRI